MKSSQFVHAKKIIIITHLLKYFLPAWSMDGCVADIYFVFPPVFAFQLFPFCPKIELYIIVRRFTLNVLNQNRFLMSQRNNVINATLFWLSQAFTLTISFLRLILLTINGLNGLFRITLFCVHTPLWLAVFAVPLEQPLRAVFPQQAGSLRTGSLSTGRISCAPSDKTPRRGSYSGRISECGSVCAGLRSRGLSGWFYHRLWSPRRPPQCRKTPPDHRSPFPGPPRRSQTPCWKDPSFSRRA